MKLNVNVFRCFTFNASLFPLAQRASAGSILVALTVLKVLSGQRAIYNVDPWSMSLDDCGVTESDGARSHSVVDGTGRTRQDIGNRDVNVLYDPGRPQCSCIR